MQKKKPSAKRPTRLPQQRRRQVESYEHRDKQRVNNPPVGLVTPDTDPDAGQKKKTYAYDPHLDPQLQWSGKAEHTSFEVPTVSLHVHEHIDPRTIIEAVRKNSLTPSPSPSGRGGREAPGEGYQLPLFEVQRKEPLRQAVEFYQHKHGWTNRLIAGDSLLVMNSLLEKEDLAGKVQMVYLDPPYGIKYGSNFQPFVNKRDVKDGKDEDLTAEPEQIRAFRDTWELGIHSYLTYLRDRLLLARELLAESGSLFVQIGDENVHHVRELMDELFGAANFVEEIAFRKKNMTLGGTLLEGVCDYIIWYARNRESTKFRRLFATTDIQGDTHWNMFELADGSRHQMTREQVDNHKLLPDGVEVFTLLSLYPAGSFDTGIYEFEFEGKKYRPPAGRSWKSPIEGMQRLLAAGHVFIKGKTPRFVRYFDDFPYCPIINVWSDTSFGGFVGDQQRIYVVRTYSKVIERCLLMTTDPGDLVFDPTCGSGTTAYVAEQWGRRWITCDTSRVALTLAKQRLMTAVFDYYELAHPHPNPLPVGEGDRYSPLPMGEGGRRPGEGIQGVWNGFKYKTVPHVTLKSIANNPGIDGIQGRWTEKLEEFLVSSFEFLDRVSVHRHLEKAEFALLDQSIKEAAKDDPQLASKNSQLKTLLAIRRAEIDAAIARHADQETLYDQPYVDRKKVRVTGPFTVEAVPAPTVAPLEQFLVSSSQFSEEGSETTKNSKLTTENYFAATAARRGPAPRARIVFVSHRRSLAAKASSPPTNRCAWSSPSARNTGRLSSGRWPRPSKRRRRWCPNPSSSSSPPSSSTRRRPRTSTRPTGRV